MFTCWNRVDGRRITMLALSRAGVCAFVDAVVVGRERHDCREDSAVVRGVGDGLPLPPIPFLLFTVGRRLLLLVRVLEVRDVLVIPALVLVDPAVGVAVGVP